MQPGQPGTRGGGELAHATAQSSPWHHALPRRPGSLLGLQAPAPHSLPAWPRAPPSAPLSARPPQKWWRRPLLRTTGVAEGSVLVVKKDSQGGMPPSETCSDEGEMIYMPMNNTCELSLADAGLGCRLAGWLGAGWTCEDAGTWQASTGRARQPLASLRPPRPPRPPACRHLLRVLAAGAAAIPRAQVCAPRAGGL